MAGESGKKGDKSKEEQDVIQGSPQQDDNDEDEVKLTPEEEAVSFLSNPTSLELFELNTMQGRFKRISIPKSRGKRSLFLWGPPQCPVYLRGRSLTTPQSSSLSPGCSPL